MPADIVKDVGLLQVIELITAADEAGRGEAAAGEKGEEDVIGDQTGHRQDLPPSGGVEHLVQPAEIRDPVGGDPEPAQSIEKFTARTPDQQPLLALEEQPPDRVLFLTIILPMLRYRKI